MSNATITLAYLKGLDSLTFMEDTGVRDNFIKQNMAIRGASEVAAESFHARESAFMRKRIIESATAAQGDERKDLRACTVFSLYGAFMDIAINGLSLSPSDKLTYLQQRGAKVGINAETGQEIWEQRASLTISPYGELAIRMESGQILYADDPIIVYEGEKFKIFINDQGNKVVNWEANIPRKTGKIIGSFIKLTRPNMSFDYGYLLEQDIDRLKKYSLKQNKTSANDLYGKDQAGIDSGFLKAKTIKHAFKTFPPVKIKGTNSELEGAVIEENENEVPEMNQYQETKPAAIPSQTVSIPTEPVKDFTPPTAPEPTVIVYDQDDTF